MEQTSLTPATNRSLEISQEVKEIGKVIWHLNQVVAYPMSDIQISDWSKSILELRPNIDLAALKFLIDRFKTGEREYDYHKGIQNIFIGMQYVYKAEVGYKLSLNPIAVYTPRQEGTNNQEILNHIYEKAKS